MLLAVLCTTIGSNWPSVNAAPKAKAVTGSATITVQGGNVIVTFKNLANVPAGVHAAHIHKGSCPLNIPDPGTSASGADVILDPNNIVALGTFKAAAGGGVASKKFQGKAPADGSNVLGGSWFVCVHAGSLADVGKAQDPVKQLGNDIAKKKPEITQIICADIPKTGKTSETIKINGVAKK
jgi:hypothetical protein